MSTRYQFIDDSGETRLAGFLEPDPGGSNPLLHVSGSLTSAQILSLHSVPVELVAAPGAGKAFVPFFGSIVVLGGNTPYADGGELAAGPAAHFSDSFWQFTGAQDALHDFTASTDYIVCAAGASTDPASEFDDAALVLSCRTADFTGGDGTLNYSLYYEIVDLT